jgi:hypothetical protein
MECRDAQHIRARFQDIYQPALLANWKIWPAVQVRYFARFFLGIVESRHHSLSTFVSCPSHIVSHSNKHAAFSGPSTCLFSILRMSFLRLLLAADSDPR